MNDGYEGQCRQCRKLKYSHICAICGEKFINDKKNTKYCSRKCRGMSDRNRIYYNCDCCGKESYSVVAEYNRYKNHYCCNECKNKHQMSLYSGEDRSTYSKITYNCDFCGKENKIKKSKYYRNKYHFCSAECMDKWRVGKFCGENSARWNFELSNKDREETRKYEEYHSWRGSVFKRDNYTCQTCGVKSKNIVAHHLDGYNWCVQKRIDISNGITLCEVCHKKFHSIYGNGNNTKEQFITFKNNQ